MHMILAQEPEFTIRYLERVENATVEEQRAAIDQFGNEPLPEILSVDGNTARISISGPLSPVGPSAIARFFGFGGTGYLGIINAVREVRDNLSITEVRFATNSPGGTVAMVDETRQAIAELAKTKRVIFENHGLVASAALWLASAGHEIVAMAPTVETGSIGIRIFGFDYTAALKEHGIKKVVILSRNAPNKASGVDTKDGRDELQRQADAIERIFISRIAEGFGVSEQTVIDDFGKGGLLIARDPDSSKPDAISVGLVNRLAEGSDVTMFTAEGDDEGKNAGIKGADGAMSGARGQRAKIDRQRIQGHTDRYKPELPRQKGGDSSASSSTEEDKPMTLKILLAENPGAQAEYDAAIKSAHEQGVTDGQAKIEARIESAKPFLSADSKYAKPIMALAAKVVAGESDPSALIAAVAAVDAMAESAASNEAAGESDRQGDINAQEHSQGSGAVVTETNEDFDAAVAAGRKSRGLED